MNRELSTILKDSEVVTRLKDIGFFTEGAGSPASTTQFVRGQYDAWAKLVREIGLQPE